MGKKKDKSKKGHGAEKTASKTEKKITKKTKKELVAHGEEDIETIIAQIAEKDKKQNEVVIEKCQPPAPRSSCSFSLHPERDELVIFGGEYFNGSKTFLYNDLYSYSVKKNEWTVIKAPNSPPPRCAHQAVTLKSGGGQLWVFGGEFASPTQSQFYHYRDLWVYHFRDHRWEKVNATGGPSARSGHRMVAFRKLLVVFGGFHDNLRDCKYFNDVHVFDTETYRWLAVEVQGVPPAPRSACQLCVTTEPSRIVMFGGYSKERVKKDVDKGRTHTDAYTLCPVEGGSTGDTAAVLKWKWQLIKQCGDCPAARTGFACATLPGNRLLLFGGVRDEDDNEEDVQSLFFNDLYILDLSCMRWHAITLRRDRGAAAPSEKKPRRKLKAADGGSSSDQAESGDAVDEVMEDDEAVAADAVAASAVATTFDDGIFKVTIGPQSSASNAVGVDSAGTCEPMDQDVFSPRPRMNAVALVKNGTLYLYGGMFEEGDKQFTLDDLHSLDTQRFSEWSTLYAGTFQTQSWQGSESESSASDDDEDDEDDEDQDSGSANEGEPPPVINAGESEQAYFVRTKEFWLERASSSRAMSEDEVEALPAGKLRQLALDMARLHFSGSCGGE